MLKAQLDQQMFVDPHRIENLSEEGDYGDDYGDYPLATEQGHPALGTVHPAIQGMLQRYQDQLHSDHSYPGTYPPNLNLESGREAQKRIVFQPGSYQSGVRWPSEQAEHYEAGGSIAQGPRRTGGRSELANPDMAAPGGPYEGYPKMGEPFRPGTQGDQRRHWATHPTQDERAATSVGATPAELDTWSEGDRSWRPSLNKSRAQVPSRDFSEETSLADELDPDIHEREAAILQGTADDPAPQKPSLHPRTPAPSKTPEELAMEELRRRSEG